jgi:hypothetical protein
MSGLKLLPLRSAINRLQRASFALDYERAAVARELEVGPWDTESEKTLRKRIKKINAALVAFERGFISEAGIKDREWYRHLGVAPGKWLGKFHILLPSFSFLLWLLTLFDRSRFDMTRLTHTYTQAMARRHSQASPRRSDMTSPSNVHKTRLHALLS